MKRIEKIHSEIIRLIFENNSKTKKDIKLDKFWTKQHFTINI